MDDTDKPGPDVVPDGSTIVDDRVTTGSNTPSTKPAGPVPGRPWLRPWKPGQSGNPKGRVKGTSLGQYILADLQKKASKVGGIVPDLATKLGMNPEKVTLGQVLARRVILNAAAGNGTALKELLDRTDGPVKQEISVNANVVAVREYLAEMRSLTCPDQPVMIDVQATEVPALPPVKTDAPTA